MFYEALMLLLESVIYVTKNTEGASRLAFWCCCKTCFSHGCRRGHTTGRESVHESVWAGFAIAS